jgi:hypothetical protein
MKIELELEPQEATILLRYLRLVMESEVERTLDS